ncbi:MAG: hypothetical protein JST11_24205 [Acidobacteria bacterium]|nr:hypothetical protein [Acidobacteriota bacterium]
MRRTVLAISAAALAVAGQLMAGGFWLQAGNPEASAEARAMHAVVTLKAAGCHDPAQAKVTAVAVGVVNGERRTIPLEVKKLSVPGMFAIAQQWPKDGKWVIRLEGRSDEAVTSTLLAAGPEGVDRTHARSEMRVFAENEVDAMLR